MDYHLYGYLRLSPEQTGWLVPIFSRERSNRSYAQEVDEAGRISSFLEFNWEEIDFGAILTTRQNIARSEGDVGIRAVLVDHEVVVGNGLSELLTRLGTFDKRSWPAFFRFEVAALSGDGSEIRKSTSRVKEVFGNRSAASRWLKRERGYESSRIYTVRSIEVSGTQRIEPETVMSVASIEIGQLFGDRALKHAWRELNGTGLFESVDVAIGELGDFRIRVKEYPRLSGIEVVGASRISNARLQQALLREGLLGQLLGPSLAARIAPSVFRLYAEHGAKRPKLEVTSESVGAANEATITVTVTETEALTDRGPRRGWWQREFG
jgi:hypothetical protein